MSKQQRGLGKGLGALLGGETDLSQIRKPVGYVNKEVVRNDQPQDTSDILRIPVDLIEPNPFQPRMSFDQEALEELADSIRTLGLIQPITVRRKADGRYQIISGERRFRACQLTGMDMIPAYIRDTNDQGMLEMAIVENIQRENLDPIEVALSYQRLIEECSLTQEQMAVRVGKKRASVTNYLRLLKLPAKIQHDLKVGLLSVGHAKVLLQLKEDEQKQIDAATRVAQQGLTVRQTEQLVKALLASEDEKPVLPTIRTLPEPYEQVCRQLSADFGTKVNINMKSKSNGTIEIPYVGKDELVRILQLFGINIPL